MHAHAYNQLFTQSVWKRQFLLFAFFKEINVSYYLQTFEAKMHHLETRVSRKPKDGLQDLEYFVRCEVHLSDVNTLVSSLKRIADDVRTTQEVKCKLFELTITDYIFNIILL